MVNNWQLRLLVLLVNAGGEAEVSATESVDAKTRAGGNITVYGNPADKKTKKKNCRR